MFPYNQFHLAYANVTLNESRVCFLDSRVEHSSGIKEGNLAFCAFTNSMVPGGWQFGVKFYCRNFEEGKLTSGTGNLCFPSCCFTDSNCM